MTAREEPLATYDSPAGAAKGAALWAAEVVRHGLAPAYGVFIRFIRTGPRSACWGIFVGPNPAGGGGVSEQREAGR